MQLVHAVRFCCHGFVEVHAREVGVVRKAVRTHVGHVIGDGETAARVIRWIVDQCVPVCGIYLHEGTALHLIVGVALGDGNLCHLILTVEACKRGIAVVEVSERGGQDDLLEVAGESMAHDLRHTLAHRIGAVVGICCRAGHGI